MTPAMSIARRIPCLRDRHRNSRTSASRRARPVAPFRTGAAARRTRCSPAARIDPRASRQPLQQQPALVERAAGDGELAALEIGDLVDRRPRRRHHGAERARRRIEDEVVAERAFARDPQPVRQHHVGRAALERDLAGLGRGELERLDPQIGFAVEAVRLDDVEPQDSVPACTAATWMRSAAVALVAANARAATAAICRPTGISCHPKSGGRRSRNSPQHSIRKTPGSKPRSASISYDAAPRSRVPARI